MKYFDVVRGSVITFVLLIFISFGFDKVIDTSGTGEMELILTVSTFLFAILVGFFISRLNGRYNRMKELVSTEDALWQSILRMAPLLGDDFYKKLIEVVDSYYLIAFDYELGVYYKHNAKYVDQVYQLLEGVKIESTDRKADNVFDDFLVFLKQLEDGRNRTSVISEERLTKGQWTTLLLLAVIVIFSIFFLQGEAIYSQVISILLASTITLILFIMRDLENFRLGGKISLDESGQNIFEYIGKLRYYNKKYLDERAERIPSHIKTFRIGIHEPGEEQNIKLARNGDPIEILEDETF